MVQKDKDLLTERSRRSFMKAAGTIGGLSALPNTVVAQETLTHRDVFQGSKSVVDIKITHPDANSDISRGSGSGGPRTNYVYNNDLYLIKSPISTVRETDAAILRSPETITAFDKATSYKQKELYETFEYGSTVENFHLSPQTKYSPFELGIRMNNGNVTVSRGSNTILDVDSGTQKSTALDQRELGILIAGESNQISITSSGVNTSTTTQPDVETRTVTVSPELTLRNHGEIGVYGVENGVVVPENSDEIRSLVGGKSTTTELIAHDVSDTDMIVIKDSNRGGD